MFSDGFHWILLMLGAVSLVALIVNIKRNPVALPKKKDGARQIFIALISIAGEVLTKGTPTLVLFTGYVVAETDEATRMPNKSVPMSLLSRRCHH